VPVHSIFYKFKTVILALKKTNLIDFTSWALLIGHFPRDATHPTSLLEDIHSFFPMVSGE
jgi:hypothetical protein